MSTSLIQTGVRFPDNSVQTTAAESEFTSGTRMIFQQTSAPTGWTKVTSGIDNHALRVVTGSAGSGGANAFTTAFNDAQTTENAGLHNHDITVNNHTLNISRMPSHSHQLQEARYGVAPGGLNGLAFTGGFRGLTNTGGSQAHNHGASSANAGVHNHTFNLDVQYLDVIVAEKD